ncbi:MAG: beta-lactamase family protein [Gemmatimonadaceae bacterium]|nr:beta-lactamase family protein [Gemmatimonadaceae bacterium]
MMLSALCATGLFGRITFAQAASGTGLRAARCFGESFTARIRGAIEGYTEIAGIPGVSVGVVVNDGMVYADGIGYASRHARIPATADTPYNVASVTKLFTATLAIQLAVDGLLDLEAPVSRYLPDSVRVPLDPTGHSITARHLLTHSAQLPRNPPNRRNQPISGPIDPGVWDAYDVSDLYSALAATKLSGPLGETMEYSNYGYALLGHVVERVAGQPYEQLLRARLLAPLRMTESGITMSAAQMRRRAADYWEDDDARVEQRTHARFGEVAGFIGMTSTVRDLSRFLIAHLGTTADDRRALSRDVAARMAEPQLHVETTSGRRYDMALGWFRRIASDSVSATPLLWHTGEIDGHSSGVFLRPQERIGIIVLQNLGGETGARAIEQLGDWMMRLTQAEISRCRR